MKIHRANLIQITILLTIFHIVTTACHEYAHMTAMELLGYEGFITSKQLDRVYWADSIIAPPMTRFAVGLAGGWAVAAGCLIAWKLDSDPENDFLYLLFGGRDFVYAPFEAVALRNLDLGLFRLGSSIGLFFQVALVLAYLMLGRFKVREEKMKELSKSDSALV